MFVIHLVATEPNESLRFRVQWAMGHYQPVTRYDMYELVAILHDVVCMIRWTVRGYRTGTIPWSVGRPGPGARAAAAAIGANPTPTVDSGAAAREAAGANSTMANDAGCARWHRYRASSNE